MKVSIFLFLFGLASASLHSELEEAADEFLLDFLGSIELDSSLKSYYGEHADAVEDDIKTEIGAKLKEALNEVLSKLKEAVEKGKVVSEELLEKVAALRRKLKDLREEVGEKGRELLDQIREKAREYLRRLLEKEKREADERIEEALSDLNLQDVLRKIKEHIKNNIDPELLKEKIEKLFHQGSEILRQLLQTLKEKGKNKLMILIDSLLDDDDDDEVSKRGISEYWEKIKDYFKDLKIDLQEKYIKFGEWVKNRLDKGMEHSKDKMDNIKAIAREFLKHAKGISKEIASEAGEFFRNYKEDLGNVWEEIKEKLKEIKDRKDN